MKIRKDRLLYRIGDTALESLEFHGKRDDS